MTLLIGLSTLQIISALVDIITPYTVDHFRITSVLVLSPHVKICHLKALHIVKIHQYPHMWTRFREPNDLGATHMYLS